jgi:putative Mg2+ transporter-C (MgtC) family protein
MPVTLSWQQIALRIALALAASFLIGYDRDEHGKTTGIRTTMLVCLAATLAMLQANLLMNSTGKAHDSFVVLDLMRMPLGILSGIGFIGAGAILRKDGLVHGLTTAATIWFITVLGLLFGGGQLVLASSSTIVAYIILWGLKRIEKQFHTHRSATLTLELPCDDAAAPALREADLRTLLHTAGYSITNWTSQYVGTALHTLHCELRWESKGGIEPSTPTVIHELASSAAIARLTWKS